MTRVLTLLFEFALGRFAGLSWQEMFAEYDLSAGRLWALVPAWAIRLVPPVARRLPTKRLVIKNIKNIL